MSTFQEAGTDLVLVQYRNRTTTFRNQVLYCVWTPAFAGVKDRAMLSLMRAGISRLFILGELAWEIAWPVPCLF